MPYCFSCGMRTDSPSGVCPRCAHDMRLKDNDYRHEVAHKAETAQKASMERRGLRVVP